MLRLAVGVGVANVLGAPEGQHRQENDGQQADTHAPAGPLTERLAQLPVGNDGEDEGRDADDEAEEPIPHEDAEDHQGQVDSEPGHRRPGPLELGVDVPKGDDGVPSGQPHLTPDEHIAHDDENQKGDKDDPGENQHPAQKAHQSSNTFHIQNQLLLKKMV